MCARPLLRFAPRRRRKSVRARDASYSWEGSPFKEPMPSDPSPGYVDGAEPSELDAAAGGADSESESGGGASLTFSRNVADGTKKRLPVTAVLKSRSRS